MTATAIGPLIGLAFVAIMALLAWILISNSRAKRRRRDLVSAWATANGWGYQASAPELMRRWEGPPFEGGGSESATELLTSTWRGRPATSFCYRYTDHRGETTSSYSFQVLTLGLPVRLPTLQLTPGGQRAKGLRGKAANALGLGEPEFESGSAEFNRTWRVTSPVPSFATEVVQPGFIELMLSPGAPDRFRIEGTEILTWSGGEPDLESITVRLAALEAVLQAIPRSVWLAHGYDPGGAAAPAGA